MMIQTKDNTFDKGDFLVVLLSVGVSISNITYFINYVLLDCESSRQGFLKSVLLGVGVALINFGIIEKEDRTIYRAMISMVTCVGVYTIYIYDIYSYVDSWKICKMAFTIVVMAMVLYLSMGKKRVPFSHYVLLRIQKSFHLVHILFALASLIIGIALPHMYLSRGNQDRVVGNFLQMEEDSSYDETFEVKVVYGDEYCLKNNLDLLKCFADEDQWMNMSLEKRRDAIKALVACEARYLGVPFTLSVRFSDDMQHNTKACYSANKHVISYNNEYLEVETAQETLKNVLHEVRHSFQNALTMLWLGLKPEEKNMACFRETRSWAMNIEKYIDGTEDIEGYKAQVIEQDAFAYSERESKVYLEEIARLLSEQSDN